MTTYGELKHEIPTMPDATLRNLRDECVDSIDAGIKTTAERDLLEHVEDELARRGQCQSCPHPASNHADTADAFCTVETCSCRGLHL